MTNPITQFITPVYSNTWYLCESGTVSWLAGPGLPIPAANSTVAAIQGLAISDTNCAFLALLTNGTHGIFLMSGTNIETVAATGLPLPAGNGAVSIFHNLAFDEHGVAFIGLNTALQGSLFRYYEGALETVVGVGSTLPGTTAPLERFGGLAFDGGNTAFSATVLSTNEGVYLFIGATMEKIILDSETLNGDPLLNVYTTTHALSGNTLGFVAYARNGRTIIAKADVAFDDMVPVIVDYDGDGDQEPAFYDEKSDVWFVRSKENDFVTHRFGYGSTIPAPADFDNDGITDRAVYDPPYGNWYILCSRDGFGVHQFGYPGALPMPRDYDGDGAADLCVYDPVTGMWYMLGAVGGFRLQQFGHPGTTPVPADVDDDGQVDLVQYEHLTGNWYVLPSAGEFNVRQFGYVGVTPLAVDFDGNGADYAVFDRSNGRWYSLGQVDGFQVREFGYNGVQPVSADYDGDAKSDLGVYDRNSAIWYLLRTTQGFRLGGL